MARDIKQDVIRHLREHFDASAISVPFDAGDATAPADPGGVRFADYDGKKEFPQVAIVSADPVVPGGGQTQYTGIAAGGRGGVQDTVTSVQIDCWGGPRDDTVYQEHGSHPDVVAGELGWEVHRVLFESDESDEGPPTPEEYEWINAEPPTSADDVDRTPTHRRRIVIARLKHTTRP